MLPILMNALSRLSRACGFETIDSFPPGHPHARTRWDRAYFDIASDLKPDAIERALCDAIANTPAIFAHIVNPTPRMQRTLLGVIDTRLRRSCGNPADLVKLLIDAFQSPHTQEAIPGLRAAIEQGQGDEMASTVRRVLDFLGSMPAAFDVIDAHGPT
jgi:hypothetical protein